MKVYGKAVSPFYAMLHYEGLPDAVEIFFEEYVNEAFFFHKKEKGNRFGTARLFS